MQQKGFVHFLLVFIVFAILIITSLFYLFTNGYIKLNNLNEKIVKTETQTTPTLSPTPTPYQFPYKNPTIKKTRSYRTILVGDSIVETLGANANVLRIHLIDHYPDSEFVNYNYGYGATNVLSLTKRLTEPTKNRGDEKPAILKQGFELIIIESFGFNPLSEFTLEEGMKKQNEVLEEAVRMILREKPDSALAFLTPIAPSPGDFGKGTIDLSPEMRSFWANERIAYIENHKKFAEAKGIPVIDVYTMSLGANGIVENKYISNDFIHPSEAGVELMSKAIADYIFENKIFPQ